MVVRDDNLHTNKFRNNNLHEMIHYNNLKKHCHKHKFANDWPRKIICKVFKRYAEQQFVKKKLLGATICKWKIYKFTKRFTKKTNAEFASFTWSTLDRVQWVDLYIMDFLGRKEKSEYLNAQNGTNRK